VNYRGIRTGRARYELITKQKIPMPQLSTATATGILSTINDNHWLAEV
jgi:hypothetical protein